MARHEASGDFSPVSLLRRLLLYLVCETTGRVTLVLAVLVVSVVAGGYWAWRHVGLQVLSGQEYLLTAEAIELSPAVDTAPWIRHDLRSEALGNAGLSRSLLIADDALAKSLYDAFSLHPWVEKVHRVVKRYPAGALIELTYRRPVAMVKVEGQGTWPVDGSGIVLPIEDFSPVEMARYPAVLGVNAPPTGPVGSRWGDGRVSGAATIAAALVDAWNQLGLAAIQPRVTASATDSDEEFQFVLWTAGGTRVQWGRVASQPHADEPSTGEKAALLIEYANKHGSLDQPGGHELDLRRRGQAIQVPSAAARERPQAR